MTDPTKPTTWTTPTGRAIGDPDIVAMAARLEVEEFDVELVKTRRRGRPSIGAAPSMVVPVRIDPELRGAIDARAMADGTTVSEVIREALRRYLQGVGRA